MNWTDNSDNEISFVVQGCQQITEGKGKNRTVVCIYSEVGTVETGVTSFPVELPNENDHFRVKAENGEGSSAWSNVVNI